MATRTAAAKEAEEPAVAEAPPGEEAAVDEEQRVVDARRVADRDLPLVQKIVAAMGETARVAKRGRNREQNYDFASAEDILAEVREPLHQRGVLLTPRPTDYDEQTITSSRGSEGTRIVLTLSFEFTDGETSHVVEGWRGEGQDYGDKAYGKAYTNALKTFVRAQWLLPTGDDPEASDPGDRVAPNGGNGNGNGNGRLPGWAQPATDRRKKEFLQALTPIIGEERAKGLAIATVDTFSVFPDVLVGFAKGLATHYVGVQQAGGVAAVAPEAQAAKAAAKAAEGPDDPSPATSDAAGESDAPGVVSTQHVTAPDEVRTDVPDGLEPPPGTGDVTKPAPASVPHPGRALKGSREQKEAVMRGLGCICTHPLTNDGDNDQCPIEGHGIPF